MTGEHIWSAWMGKMFGLSQYNFRRVEPDASGTPKITHQWRVPSIDLKVRVVCEECNHGWMSELENETKQVIKDMIENGYALSLLPAGAASIAAFAFKTTVVVDYMNTGRRPYGLADNFFKRATRERFKASLSLPEGVQIWLAEFRSKAVCAGRLHPAYFKFKVGPLKDFYFYVLTYAVGHFVFQILCSRRTKRTRRRQSFPNIIQRPEWDAASIPIWPNHGLPVGWPPSQHFSDGSLNLFGDRWSAMPI